MTPPFPRSGRAGLPSPLRPATMLRRSLLVFAATLPLHPVAAPLAAQARPDPRIENRMLREASAQEARGELGQAESTVRELLALHPGSSSAVIALERILRAAGRVADVLPALDAFLADGGASGRIRALQLTIVAELANAPAVEAAVRAWIRADPESLEPWLEGAKAWRALDDPGRGAALLGEGVAERGEHPALLIDLGDLHAEAGRLEEATASWARALGRDRASRGAVIRRIERLDDDERGAAARRIVAALMTEPTTVARLDAGAELALREQLEDDALILVERALQELDEREARGFLTAFARRAEELDRDGSALRAWTLLREVIDDPAEARAADERLAEAALAAGDSAAALEAMTRITDSHPPGSAERRRSWTGELRIRVESPDAGGALAALQAFRAEFPESPDLDDLSSTLASRLLGLGMRAEAMEVLDGIEGPGAALERAFLLLEGGALPQGAMALQAALPELDAAAATEILALTLSLSELTPPGGALAAEVAIARHRGRPGEGVGAVRARADAIPASDRPAVLAMGARAADEAGLASDAAAFRQRIVAEHGDAREYPEAALALARALAEGPQGRAEAVRILEELIVRRPQSPVAPGARVELERIREGGLP